VDAGCFVTETELDAVFVALGSQARRHILDIIAAQPGCTVSHVAERFEMSRVGVLKHINVLEDAGLVISERVGRERPLHFNPVPLQLIQERWSSAYGRFWAARLTRLKFAVEGRNR
jgi:DNA-binding transcriptional ArsR family regulator